MEIDSARRDRILLCGMGFYGNPFGQASAWSEENEIGRLWKRFMACFKERPEAFPPGAESGPWYELHLGTAEAAVTGDYEVFVGVEIPDPLSAPLSCSLKVLPPSEYARLTLSGEEIVSNWGLGLEEAVREKLGRALSWEFSFQLYDERFKGMDKVGESILDVYLPLKIAANDSV